MAKKAENKKKYYVVFKYDFHKLRNLSKVEENLFPESLEILTPEYYQKCQEGFERVMDSLLKSKKMTLVETNKVGEQIIHDNRILGFREGVAVLDVCADKKEFYWSEFKENEIHNQPFCKVIVDNRPQKGYLFVEVSKEFGNKKGQDKVVGLLRDNINRVANQYGWDMVISAKLPAGDLYDAVEERLRQGCAIKSVEFLFPRGQTLSDAPADFSQQLLANHRFMESLNAQKHLSRYYANKGEQLRFDKTQRDLDLMVQLCTKEDYGVKVCYWKGPCTDSRGMKRMKVQIDDSEVEALVRGETCFLDTEGKTAFFLINSLDKIQNDIKGCSDEVIED